MTSCPRPLPGATQIEIRTRDGNTDSGGIEPVRSYRRATVQVIGNSLSKADLEGEEIGRRLADRILQTLPSAQKVVEGFIQRKIPLASLADAAAFHLPLALELKLQLLAEADVLVRAELLLASLPPAKASDGGGRWYPVDFSSN